MNVLAALPDISALAVVAKDVAPLSESTGSSLTNEIRTFIAPFIFIAIAGFALVFLVRRQTSAFLSFLIISIGVLAVFYSPEILGSAGRMVANWFGGSTGGDAAGG